jgi:hypothetical protein
VLDHVSAMIKGPKIKKERDQLLMNFKLKEVLHGHELESMATYHNHKEEKKQAELERVREKAENDKNLLEHDKMVLEERLHSHALEKQSQREAHDAEVKALDTEQRLRQGIELEYICFFLYANDQEHELTGKDGIQPLSTEYDVGP